MNFKSFFKIILPLALGVFFIYLSINITTVNDREMIIQSIRNADLKFVFLGLFFAVLSHLSRAYRWGFLLSPMGYRPKLINSILCVLIAYLANMGVPRSGEVIRASFISNYEKIPFEKAFGSIVVERIIDVLILFILILYALQLTKLCGKLLEFLAVTSLTPSNCLTVFNYRISPASGLTYTQST